MNKLKEKKIEMLPVPEHHMIEDENCQLFLCLTIVIVAAVFSFYFVYRVI